MIYYILASNTSRTPSHIEVSKPYFTVINGATLHYIEAFIRACHAIWACCYKRDKRPFLPLSSRHILQKCE